MRGPGALHQVLFILGALQSSSENPKETAFILRQAPRH